MQCCAVAVVVCAAVITCWATIHVIGHVHLFTGAPHWRAALEESSRKMENLYAQARAASEHPPPSLHPRSLSPRR